MSDLPQVRSAILCRKQRDPKLNAEAAWQELVEEPEPTGAATGERGGDSAGSRARTPFS